MGRTKEKKREILSFLLFYLSFKEKELFVLQVSSPHQHSPRQNSCKNDSYKYAGICTSFHMMIIVYLSGSYPTDNCT